MNVKQLERAAKDAHKRGEGWSTFWTANGDAVRQLEPIDRNRFHRLRQRLLSLLVAGNTDGQEPPPVMPPWEVTDAAPHDVLTQARFSWDEAAV